MCKCLYLTKRIFANTHIHTHTHTIHICKYIHLERRGQQQAGMCLVPNLTRDGAPGKCVCSTTQVLTHTHTHTYIHTYTHISIYICIGKDSKKLGTASYWIAWGPRTNCYTRLHKSWVQMAAIGAAIGISLFCVCLCVDGIGAVLIKHDVYCGNAHLFDRCVWLSHCCADARLACRCLRPRVKHYLNHLFCIFEKYWEVCSWRWYGLGDDSDRAAVFVPWQHQHRL